MDFVRLRVSELKTYTSKRPTRDISPGTTPWGKLTREQPSARLICVVKDYARNFEAVAARSLSFG